MTDVAVRKSLGKFSGRVEYDLYFHNPLFLGRDPEEAHFESYPFDTLAELLKLLSPDVLLAVKHEQAADRVEIANIYFSGRNEDGDGAAICLGKTWTGWTKSKVSSEHFDSKMNHCVEELEKQLQEMQNTILRHRA